MEHRANRVAAAGVIVACLFVAGTVFADPIQGISSDVLASTFDNSGGTYSHGVLTIDDHGDIVVEYLSSSTTTYAGGYVLLTTSLFEDCSTGGQAWGIFKGGSILLETSGGADLLTATIDTMEVKELAGQPDTLAGLGTFSVTGGSLAGDFGRIGEVFQLTFSLNPSGITDFSHSGEATTDLKLTPIPEPATLLLVGSAGLSALGWIRRRRMKD